MDQVKANIDRLESYNALPEMNALNDMKKRKKRKRRVRRDTLNQFETADVDRYDFNDNDDDEYNVGYEP